MRDIALMGRAGAGKDTVAEILAEQAGHVRVALADPLKRMALAANPVVARDPSAPDGLFRLKDLVDRVGWDDAKRACPEVRAFLQRLGSEGVRDVIGADTWIRVAHVTARQAWDAGKPVVITDVRFPNEVAWARRTGFDVWWIDRPGVYEGGHASESAVQPTDADRVLYNGGDRADLFRLVAWHLSVAGGS